MLCSVIIDGICLVPIKMINPGEVANFPCFNRVSLETVVFSLLCHAEACYSIPLSLNEGCFCLGAGAGMLTHTVPMRHAASSACVWLGAGLLSQRFWSALNQDLLKYAHLSQILHHFLSKILINLLVLLYKYSVYFQWRIKHSFGIPEPYIVPALSRMVQASFAKYSLE